MLLAFYRAAAAAASRTIPTTRDFVENLNENVGLCRDSLVELIQQLSQAEREH